jgi:hypothetical protein
VDILRRENKLADSKTKVQVEFGMDMSQVDLQVVDSHCMVAHREVLVQAEHSVGNPEAVGMIEELQPHLESRHLVYHPD